MGDEITKKDLQSLQGYCNKQIADLEKKLSKGLADETAALNRTIEILNKNDAELKRAADEAIKNISALNENLKSLTAVVNQHAKAINERG
jgi:predicted  nucleic acid-binding Zn-ribbon protein